MSKRKIINTLELATEKLNTVTQDIQILEYAGKVTDNSSVFYNKLLDVEFTSSLNTVIKRIRKGETPKIGSRAVPNKDFSPTRDLEADLRQWLADNVPQVELVEYSGSYSEPCLFSNRDNGQSQWIEPNRLKDKFRRDLQILPTTEETVKRRQQTRIKRGLTKQVQGKTLREHAEELGVAYSTFQSTLKHQGLDVALQLSSSGPSDIECIVEGWVKDFYHIRNKKLSGTEYRPDFLLPDYNVIIECDGLYWHSDLFRDKYYHREKLLTYENLGYRALFFRSDEILNKPEICKNILYHKLYTPRTIYARLTNLSAASPEFFDEWHLMGRGQGRIYALEQAGAPVAAMQVKTRGEGLEISRFATAGGVAVIGGFSKLLKYVIREESPAFVDTFIDRRYGQGFYLTSLGFEQANTVEPSFHWTDGKSTWHRMQYAGNSGYSEGLQKIWDCGQAKWRYTL